MKRFLCIFFTALLLCSALCVNAGAAAFDSAAQDLSKIGMFRGTNKGFELDRAPTRAEAAIMLVRLYGAEESAAADYEAGKISHPFRDVENYAAPYVAWLYSNGITNGTSATTFSSNTACTAQNYLTFLLRALGYEDGSDFQYAKVEDFAAEKGLLDTSMFSGTFLRDDLAAITYQGLSCDLKDGSTYLLDSLIQDGAIDAKAAQPITDKVEAYRQLVEATQGINDGLDVAIKSEMQADVTVKGVIDGQSIQESQKMPLSYDGRIQMTLSGSPQMAVAMTGGVDGESINMEVYLKDGWMYTKANDTAYKMDVRSSLEDALGSYQSLLDMGGNQVSSMLPFLDELSVTTSGKDTVYTLSLNDSFSKLLNGAMDLATGMVQQPTPGLDLDMKVSLERCTYVYTVSADQLKSVTASVKMGMTCSSNIDAQNSITLSMDMDMDMTMNVNAYGEKVQIAFPDLSGYEDISELSSEEATPTTPTTPTTPSGETSKPSSSSSSNNSSSSSVHSTVYITPTGKKYHYNSNCNGGSYSPISLENAISRGYGPCNKCVK